MEKREKNKISVIVPVYNVEDYIAKGIEAICSQTYSNLEIILIDDGSTDSSGEICDLYAEKDRRIKVCHISNSGQSHARNVGFQISSGELIGFVDGDDAPYPDMYKRLLETMEKYSADIVECNFVGRNSPPPDMLAENERIVLDGRTALYRQLNMEQRSRYPSTSVWSKLFRRELIEDICFPDGKIHEEYCYLAEALYKCGTYVYINEILYNRTIRRDSTTKEKFSARALDKLEVHRQRNIFLKGTGDQELLELSKAQEYNLLIYFYNMTIEHHMEEAGQLLKEIKNNRKNILHSRLPRKRKMEYRLFYISPIVYQAMRKIKKWRRNN